MDERTARWDERYRRGEETYDYAPSPPLPNAIASEPPGIALDLACGAGRHAIHLAERGWHVVAVDASAEGIAMLAREAAKRGVAERIDARVADLTAATDALAPDGYDLVCDFYFLERALFERIRSAVRPGGLFAAAIHVESPDAPHSFLLRPGELEALVNGWGWEILHAREGGSGEEGHRHATAELVARRPRVHRAGRV
jgi:tellurite methyltransferase